MERKSITKKVLSLILSAVLLCSTMLSNDALTLSVHAENTNSTENAVNSAMKLWYKTPANINTSEGAAGEWMQQSLPLGNGNLGNLIFGGVAKERIHFNEKTLWTGGPSSSRPNYQFGNTDTAYTAAEIQEYRLILDDKTENVFNDSMSGYGYVPIRFKGADNLYKGEYQDFGDIWLDFSTMGMTDSNVEDYRRELDLQTGIASTTFTYKDVVYTREHFVSYPDNVMVTNVTASEKGTLDVTIKMELNNGGLSGTTSLNASENICTIDGSVNDNGLKFRTTMKVIPVGGTITANTDDKTYTVADADSIMIIMAAETDYKNDFPTYRDTEKNLTAVVDGHVAAAAAKTYDQLKANHLDDHQVLFDRLSLDLGEVTTNIPTDQLVEAYRNGEYSKYLEVLSFQYGRYLTIAGSRGTLPSNLVGLWTIGGSAWTGDYHFNVNIQMNYWPVYVTNLAECGTTMVEYMENLREPGRLTAERIHGIEGAVANHIGFTVHTENNPFGMTAPSNAQEYGWNPTGAAWAIQNIWAHYEFTQDEAYLRDVIYPIMKEAALFWDNYLWTSGYQTINDATSPYNGQSRLVVAPSFSEEQGPTAIGTTYDQSLVWELYKECVQAAEILNVDAELRAQWADKMLKLDPIEINATNGIKEWYEETRVGTESGHNKSYAQAGNLAEIAVPNSGWWIGHPGEHRHASHLVGLYPGTLINKENETYMNAAIQSLTERGEYATGWSKANKINLWARTGNGNKAYRLLNNLIGGNASGLQYNLFDSHGTGGGETMMNGGNPVWQIDGNYGLTSGVAEMLIQSQLGYVQFLPAIPDAWDEGEVQGLKARGNFTIGETWANGLAESFTVCYEGDEASSEFIGEYTNIVNAKVYLDGEKVTVTKDEENGRISFDAVRGKTYTIDMSGTNTDQLGEKAEAFLPEIHPDLSAVTEELRNAIDSEASDLSEILSKARVMDKLYREYIVSADNIYYMTTQEGLSYHQIDSMYNDLRQMKAALLNNTEDYDFYRQAYENFQSIESTMLDQMDSRVISFSKESGAVTEGDTALNLSKSVSAGMYEIRYTTDGSAPRSDSALYETTIQLSADQNTTVRAALFLGEQRVSPIYTKQYSGGRIVASSAETTVGDWGAEYSAAAMIDGNTDTRWASKSPSGDIEIILNFDSATSMNAMKFDQFVSWHNETDEFEIWALKGDEYQKVYEDRDLGGDDDNIGNNYASKTFEFDTVTTTSVKIIIKEGYQEPSFWEIQPLMIETVVDSAGDPTELNAMVELAETVDRNSQEYADADQELKDAFEESIADAKESRVLTQAEIDSREEFLRNRYRRLGFGETDKSILEALIDDAETALEGDYTKDSLYYLNKELQAAKELMEDEEARQDAVDQATVALREAMDNLEASGDVTVTVQSAEMTDETGQWIDAAGGFKATNSDAAGKLSYEFTGKNIRVLTVKAQDHGILHVVITNKETGAVVYDQDIDTYATSRTDGAELLNVALENGTYTITFQRNGANPLNNGQGWVEVGQLSILQEVVEAVDRSSLEEAIAACETLVETDYTEDSWAVFEPVYEEAETVLAKTDAETCTAEMEDMSKKLTSAKKLLVEKADAVDVSGLEELLAEARAVSEEDYTEESYAALRQAILEVESFLNGGVYTQAEVTAKAAMLNQKLGGLVEADKDPEDGDKDPEDGDKDPEDGDKDPEDGDKDPDDANKDPESGDKKPVQDTNKPEQSENKTSAEYKELALYTANEPANAVGAQPATGDTANIMVYAVLLVMACMAGFFNVKKRMNR